MKKFFLILVFLCVFAGFSGSTAGALEINPKGIFWELKASYGEAGRTLSEASNVNLSPSFPYEYTVPGADYVEVYDDNQFFYAYAGYSADVDFLSATVEGYADDPSLSNEEWYSASAKVAAVSNPFSGISLLTISFDWEYDLDLSTDDISGEVAYAIGLVDWSESRDINNLVFVYKEVVPFTSGNYSGHYENSWSLDPTHEYIFGVGLKAEVSGGEDSDISEAYIEISELEVKAVPEPASVLLISAGVVLLIGIYRSRRNRSSS